MGAIIRLGIPLALMVFVELRASESAVALLVTPHAQPYAERHRATYRIGQHLGAQEMDELFAFLGRSSSEDSVTENELRALKNNVADALIAQKNVGADLLDRFILMAKNPVQDVAWREYLLQKLPDLAMRLPDPDARTRATDFLRTQAESTEYIMAGTAIIALERLGRLDPSLIGPGEIGKRAAAILQNPDQANACKIAALQVLGTVDRAAGRGEALAVLGDAARPLMLKVSALATLGACGLAEDAAVVAGFADSPDYRLRTAARAALKKLRPTGAEG